MPNYGPDPDDIDIFGSGMPMFVSGAQIREDGKDIAYLFAAMAPYCTDDTPRDDEFIIREDGKTWVLIPVDLLHKRLQDYYNKEELLSIIRDVTDRGRLRLHPRSDIEEGLLYVELA